MTLLRTKDYDMFKKNVVNRNYNEDNVKKIMNSISVRNKLNLKPIIVDKNMYVMDGQHRIEAARRLGIEVVYIIDEEATDEDIILLNANQKSWQLTDYLNYFCHKKNQDYIQLDDFLKEHDLSIMQMRALMSENDSFSINFKRGKFVFPKKDKLAKLHDRLSNLRFVQDYINDKLPNTKICHQGSLFIHALLEFFNNKKVDVKTFIEKLEYKLDLLRPCTNRVAYIIIFKNIYNWKNNRPVE